MSRAIAWGAVVSLLSLYLSLSVTNTQANETLIPVACAEREIAVITLIEDHAEVEDLMPEKLSVAYFEMLRARAACYDGQTADAIARYDGILLTLGAIHIGRMR